MSAIEQHTAVLRSGARLPYAEVGEAGGSVPVVLVHAYAESWRYFEPLLRAMPPAIHALAPTQRGHRAVEGSPEGYLIRDFASDIIDFMDAVGIARAVLVGASSGGLVSQVVASRSPERVAGLVLVSSPVTLADKPAVHAVHDEILALSDPIDPVFVEQFVRETSPSGLTEDFVGLLVDESLSIPAKVWRDAFSGLLEAERPQALEDIRVPTLLLIGGSDSIVRDDQQVLLERLREAELVVYDGVGHGLHLAQPARVATDLAVFVRSIG